MNRKEFLTQLKKNQEHDLELVKKKNSDYAAKDDPFQNFRGVEHWRITTAETGILVRLSDKMQRVCNLIDREAQVEDEKIVDTLSDARNYLNILQVYLENELEDEETDEGIDLDKFFDALTKWVKDDKTGIRNPARRDFARKNYLDILQAYKEENAFKKKRPSDAFFDRMYKEFKEGERDKDED